MMFLLRKVPKPASIERLDRSFGKIDADAAHLFLMVLKTGSDLLNALDDFLSVYGLRHGRWITLLLLMREKDMTAKPSDLADKQGVTRATMTGLLQGLTKDELVERLPDPSDGRGALVRMTGKGRTLMVSVMPAYYAKIGQLLQGVKHKRLVRTAEVLAAMQERSPMLAGNGATAKAAETDSG